MKASTTSVLLLAVAAAVAAAVMWGGSGTTRAPAPAANGTPAAKPAAPTRILAEGRLVAYPGAEVEIGTDSGGTIVSLPVDEKAALKKGDLIAEIRADDLRAALAEAAARKTEVEADIRLHQLEVARQTKLRASGMTTQQLLERSQRDLEAARARRQTTAAEVKRLDAVLAKARIVAPIDGVVIARHANPGETVPPGAKLVTLADLSRTRIEAEVDEYDAGRIRLGAPVTVRAEGFDGKAWRGKVEEIPDAVVGRKLKPLDPGRPEDTRVLLVKVALSEKSPLKLGQRVEVEIAR
ncbi:MAG: efflux RND transporter periplasmic adaptor subunit [Sulfuricella sp.]|nr:efflux RND transporter periplasmic adaptor subunit [Sulfuricella sp.]